MILLFCTFPLWIQKIAFPDPFGTFNILQNRPRNASRGAQVAPRYRPNRPLDPQDGHPDEPRALQTAFQTVQDPILEVLGPSKPRFWPPGTHFASNLEVPRPILDAQGPIFQPPGTHFPAQTSLCPSPPCLQAFPSLSKPFQVSKPPSLQASKPPGWSGGMRGAFRRPTSVGQRVLDFKFRVFAKDLSSLRCSASKA